MRSRSSSNQAAARAAVRRVGMGSSASPGSRPVWRSASPSTIAAASATLSERMPGRIGMREARVGAPRCTSGGTPGAFAADQQGVVGREGEVGDRRRRPVVVSRTRRRPGARRADEGVPGAVARELDARRDSPCRRAAAGGRRSRKPQGSMMSTATPRQARQPQHGAGILRNIGLDRGRGAWRRPRAGKSARRSATPALQCRWPGVCRRVAPRRLSQDRRDAWLHAADVA